MKDASRLLRAELGRIWADQAVASVAQGLVADMLERLTLRELRIRRALQRLDAGEYGVCLGCGHPIRPERLAVIPGAERCIRCEELSQ
ncbi:MAG: TraR/DksA family transcriptional regulator [Candidatus Rokuibacteriota bacterium]